jgi:hypothetical protein
VNDGEGSRSLGSVTFMPLGFHPAAPVSIALRRERPRSSHAAAYACMRSGHGEVGHGAMGAEMLRASTCPTRRA